MEEYVKVQKIEMHEGVKEYFMNRIDALQALSRKYVFFVTICYILRSKTKERLISALTAGISQSLQFFQNAVLFYVGSDLIQNRDIRVLDMFR